MDDEHEHDGAHVLLAAARRRKREELRTKLRTQIAGVAHGRGRGRGGAHRAGAGRRDQQRAYRKLMAERAMDVTHVLPTADGGFTLVQDGTVTAGDAAAAAIAMREELERGGDGKESERKAHAALTAANGTIAPSRTLSGGDGEDMVMNRVMDGLTTRTLQLDRSFRVSVDKCGGEHGALFLCVNGLNDALHSASLPFRFVPSYQAERLPDSRVLEGLRVTGMSRFILLVINLRVHPRHLARDPLTNMYLCPANFSMQLLNVGDRCSLRTCTTAPWASGQKRKWVAEHKELTEEGGFTYCSAACFHADTVMRRKVQAFQKAHMGVRENPVAARRRKLLAAP